MSDHATMDAPALSTADVPLQPNSEEIWDTKHRLKDQNKNPVDQNLLGEDGTFGRVARGLADLEKNPDKWYPEFLWALRSGATPAGRITANTGATEYKPSTSTINCVIAPDIRDFTGSIGDAVSKALTTLKYGSGIGYCFSTLRYKGAPVSGAGAQTGGPLGFMDIFDKACSTISSAGDRRG